MKREHSLRRRLHSLETLSEAIGAMKSLSAHHFRSARAALPAARAYREGIDQALAALGLHQFVPQGKGTGVLLIAADAGLCDGYNSRLSSTAIEHCQRRAAQRLYCVGRRPISAFKRAGIAIDHIYSAPASVAGLTESLLHVCEDLLNDFIEGRFDTLFVISARFEGVGEFTPTLTRLLPIDSPETQHVIPASDYIPVDHLSAVVVREYLYIRLFQTMLDSLASEHSVRLVATGSAGEWLDEKTAIAVRQLAATRREAATQEVLDVAATSRRRGNRSSHG